MYVDVCFQINFTIYVYIYIYMQKKGLILQDPFFVPPLSIKRLPCIIQVTIMR